MSATGALTWLAEVSTAITTWSHTVIVAGVERAGNLLFPPVCALCRCEINAARHGVSLCAACRDALLRPRTACLRCASEVPRHWSAVHHCPKCAGRHYHFERALALGEYRGSLQQAVVACKKLVHEPLTHALGQLLAVAVQGQVSSWRAEVVVPIPMDAWRRLRRGTQPSRILGECIARQAGLPLLDGLLYCRRKSKKQGTLSVAERFRNRRDAFSASRGYDITGVRVLLVDDILTTGATASEAARALRQAGAGAVAVAVVARATGRF